MLAWLRDMFDARQQPWYRAEFIHPREFADFTDPARRLEQTALAAQPADGKRQLKRRSGA